MSNDVIKKKRIKFTISILSYFVAIPLVILCGVFLFKDEKYNIISMVVALLVCIPFFINFERGKTGARELICIAVMIAMSVVGRLIFMAIPGFKPVTAIVVITAIAFGAEAGFITGAGSALISNMFYGQGAWTPFQMFIWGLIGFIAGLIFKNSKKPNIVLLIIVGLFAGVAFSLLMDIWTTISIDSTFILARYLTCVLGSFPFMAEYAISNVIFLLILTKPILEKMDRIKLKYNIFCGESSR